jgi:acylphosphatase
VSETKPGFRTFRAIVHGRVQGVGYRAFVRSRAHSLGLSGWVKNLPDGFSVEVLAHGSENKLKALLKAMSAGPPGSSVARTDVEWITPLKLTNGFEVRF